MKLKSLSLLSIAAIAVACSSEKKSAFVYPETKQVDSSRVYFGDTVPDPYAWLEDDYSEETMAWVDQQNKLTRSYLDTLSQLQKLKELMPKYWKYASYSSPKRTEAGLFYWYSDGVMNQPQLMRKTRDGQESVVLDPNSLSEDGTASINSWSVSEDGKYLAYGLSKSGSDWAEIFIKDINTGELLPDRIQWVKFSGISWDKEGFYYSAFPAPKDGNEYSAKNEFHRVFYHKLGATEDQLIYEDAQNAQRTFSAELDDDLKYLMVYGAESTSGNSISVRSAAKKTGEFTHLVLGFEHDWSYVGSYKKGLLFLTNYNAPNNQIVWIDPEKPQNQYWKTIVAEREQLLQGAVLAKDHLALNYLTDVVNSLELFELGSAATEKLRLEGKGNVGGLQYDKTEGDIYFHYEDYINPGLVYKYNIISEQLDVYKKPELPFNPENFVVEQVFYPSKDGTRIPLFIVHKKGLAKSPETPCFLYAYGGFNIAIQPHFKPDRMAFLEAGGIYAVANIRGGSEYGEAWHESGTKFNKQNVFNDFIAAAEYLQKEGYTSKEKMAVHGRSNGGLLIGAVLTQRPDLFQVALPKVGVLDMLKYHEFTIGWAWAADYGRSDDTPEMYQYLKGYSPLHNVKEIEYPATMVITGDHDDRVVPAHSFKFAAALQAKQQGTQPVLLRVDKNAGHGAGKPIEKQVEEFADQWAFVMHHTGMKL